MRYAVALEYAQVADGFGPAAVIGGIELLVMILYGADGVRHALRRRRDSGTSPSLPGRLDQSSGVAVLHCSRLTAEAIIVRERVSGRIDAATYRTRMEDLASGERS
ncbi:hypothetical protein QRB41_21735 [Mycobacterium avium subsp. hominissuis]|uniref:hypothetical protein n=1 Tax=Mycobacterium avium TaxID=1764 RepID=UPI00266565F6|nr:hypothetical protein [Mycobacterium avium]MDO2385974.1 hypothetical protein [Mycobacterium avium subsp. hominissuis]